MPGTRPGRSAMAKAMKPARIGTRKPKAAPPMTKHSAAHEVRLSGVEVLGDVELALGREAVLDDLDGALLAHGHLGEHERDGDEDAARGDERDHVGHAGHQPLAQLGAACWRRCRPSWRGRPGPPGPAASPRPPAAGGPSTAAAISAASSIEGRAVGDALLDADVDGRLAGEPAGVLDRDVVGEDHRVGGGDHGRAERRGAGRALGLDLHRRARRPSRRSRGDSAAM